MSSISSTDTTCSSAGRRPQGASEHHAWGQATTHGARPYETSPEEVPRRQLWPQHSRRTRRR